MTITALTGPTAEPVSLAEAKLHCRVDGSDDDALITTLISVARGHAEGVTKRLMMTQSMRATFEEFGEMELKAPLRKVTSVKYMDTAAVTQTLSHQAMLLSMTRRLDM